MTLFPASRLAFSIRFFGRLKNARTRGGAREVPGGATSPPKFCLASPVAPPKIFRSLSKSPAQTIDSSPCCKTGPSSAPPQNENVWLRPCPEHHVLRKDDSVVLRGKIRGERSVGWVDLVPDHVLGS